MESDPKNEGTRLNENRKSISSLMSRFGGGRGSAAWRLFRGGTKHDGPGYTVGKLEIWPPEMVEALQQASTDIRIHK